MVASRLRRGAAQPARGPSRLVADAVATARAAGATGLIVVRADSADDGSPVVAAARRAGAGVSVTAPRTPAVTSAIAGIAETGWPAIRDPNAVGDDAERRWILPRGERRGAVHRGHRPPGRRAGDRPAERAPGPPAQPPAGPGNAAPGELCAAYHGCCTDSPSTLVPAQAAHRGPAIVEQGHADRKAAPLAHLPSGSFAAHGGWLASPAMACTLTRAAGTLASPTPGKATTGTIHAQLITIPARLARPARRRTRHLPRDWP